MKLGKKPPRFDERTLKLSKYLNLALLPQQPIPYGWDGGIAEWLMLKNDTVGCCTISAAGHIEMGLTFDSKSFNGGMFTPNDNQIIASYSAVTKYTPGYPNSDTGAFCIDVLNYWRNTGIAGRAIGAYASVNVLDKDFIQKAVYIFGNSYLGVALPVSAQTQTIWDVVDPSLTGDSAPGSWGGHCIPIIAYDANYLTVITWGAPLKMTWAFLAAYCDELYAVLSNDFLRNGQAPNGFDLAALQSDLSLITS
jgi:hypothetical protein